MSFKELWESILKCSFEAQDVIKPYVHVTPVNLSATLSRICGADVFLKYENLQKTGSFKVRGALYKVSKLGRSVKGVVTASAGNHAQGVAYAASSLGLPSVVVMPESASTPKVQATEGYGAEVILYGKVYDDAYQKALEIREARGYEFIHAFNDVEVIGGQGTIGLEIINQISDFDIVIVPVGGGGLISGIASAIKAKKPQVKVIGVEPEAAPKMLLSLSSGKPISIEPKPTIADGLVAKTPGEITFEVVSNLVDEIVTVSEEEISEAIYITLERQKTLVEGAGAVGVAALISGKANVKGKKVVAVLSGGNIDLTILNKVLIRGLVKVGRIVKISGYVPDAPGYMTRILQIIAHHRGNVLDIAHDRSDLKAPAWHAKITILFETPGPSSTSEILRKLKDEGFNFINES
ncbi:MAG: threonine ammonia-lyase [Sulfolobales archaeon]|nr:threonine ammonia-lyase [Sulfolobales archaeon]